MEVVATVSSIASIASLLNQCIGNTKALRDFFADVSSASTVVKHFLRDIESLLQSFQAVNDLLIKLPPDIRGPHVLRLRIDLEDYDKDANRWVKTAKVLQPTSLSCAKAYFKKFSIAVKLKSVKDIQEELERYKNAIGLNLAILGRELDVSSATHIKQLDSKIGQGIVATLSKIEDQAAMLEKIELSSRKGMRSSAASVKSLQSVETSLSRIEALLSSAGSEPRSQSADSSKDHTVSRQHMRWATGDFDRRARRSSAGSAISRAHSSASAKSLPAVPVIPKVHLPTQPVESAKKPIQYSRRQSYPEVIENEWYDWMDIDGGAQQIDLGSTTIPSHAPTPDLYPQADGRLMKEHATISKHHIIPKITQDLLAKRHSTDVVNYISLIQDIQAHENRTSLLNLTLEYNVGVSAEERLDVVVKERSLHQDYLSRLHSEVVPCRKRCILAGHSLHEIDSRLRPRSNSSYLAQHSPDQFFDCTLTSVFTYIPPCPAENIETSVYGDWSNKRDRINRWLLHCLQSDRAQGQLHRSMLADPLRDEREWASETFLYWYNDEAATGDEIDASPSSGAVDGGELWCQESTDPAEEAVISNDLQSYTELTCPSLCPENNLSANPDLNSFELSHLFLLEEKLLTRRMRDWILINHREARSIPMRKLLKAWASFWVSTTKGINDPCEYTRALSSPQHSREFSAGVLSLLVSPHLPAYHQDATALIQLTTLTQEQTICLEDDSPTVQRDQHLRWSRIQLISSLQEFTQSARCSGPSSDQYPEIEDLSMIKDLKMTAFKIGARAIDFTEAWARTALGKSQLKNEEDRLQLGGK